MLKLQIFVIASFSYFPYPFLFECLSIKLNLILNKNKKVLSFLIRSVYMMYLLFPFDVIISILHFLIKYLTLRNSACMYSVIVIKYIYRTNSLEFDMRFIKMFAKLLGGPVGINNSLLTKRIHKDKHHLKHSNVTSLFKVKSLMGNFDLPLHILCPLESEQFSI